jgi:hypothetical protein
MAHFIPAMLCDRLTNSAESPKAPTSPSQSSTAGGYTSIAANAGTGGISKRPLMHYGTHVVKPRLLCRQEFPYALSRHE